MRLLLVLFVAITAIYLLSPIVDVGDGRNGPPTAVSIVKDGDLDLDEFRDLPWHGGYQTVSSDGSS